MTAEHREPTALELVLRYFHMWNTGDSRTAREILHPEWRDHAHPEISGPAGVEEAVERIHATQPDLRFRIDSVSGEKEGLAAVGRVTHTSGGTEHSSNLIWLIRLRDGLLGEMWTYRGDGTSIVSEGCYNGCESTQEIVDEKTQAI